MCTDATNGGFEGCKAQNDIGCTLEGEATTSESRLHLNDILDMLIRLDQEGIFMGPVDESSAPDYSKVIKRPMYFLRMREKIFAEEYTTWDSFVEDLECICHNAMKYNQKRSKIWNAAKSLLSQGKTCLEQQLMKHKVILGFIKNANGHDVSTVIGERMHEAALHSVPSERRAQGPLSKDLDSYTSMNHNLNTAAEKSTIAGTGVHEQMENSPHDRPPLLERLCDHVAVDILESHDDILEVSSNKDIRMDLRDETTDCSSSFSGTQDELDDEIREAESILRDGNGARVLTEVHDAPKRKRKALNFEWKDYRQGIEWRCRWLELRIKELEAQAVKYSRILNSTDTHKVEWLEQQHGTPIARIRTFDGYKQKTHVLKRRSRRRVEESGDITRLHMLKHPVFSRYGKKKQRSEAEPMLQGYGDDKQSLLQFNDLLDFEDHYVDNIPVQKNSVEDLLWQIESLQLQVVDMQSQLSHGGPSLSHASKSLFKEPLPSMPSSSPWANAMQAHSPGGPAARALVRGSKGNGGSSSRRRNIDFDINNVVMPDTVMANYVEPARHAFIETPHWRFVRESSPPDVAGTSNEDTDDEAYGIRHAGMQMRERQRHFTPLLLHKSRSLSSANERPRHFSAVEDQFTREDEYTLVAAGFGNIPKRKRTTKSGLHQRRGLSIGDATKAPHTNTRND